MQQRLAIGTVRTSHGVAGFLRVRSLSGEVEHFSRLKTVFLGSQSASVPFEVEQITPARGGDVLVKLKGIDTPEDARRWNGKDIWVDRREAAPLQEGEYYLADLVGCRILLRGSEVGSVRSVVEGGAADLLEVVDVEGRTFLVPFLDRFLGEVDVRQGTIELVEESLLP